MRPPSDFERIFAQMENQQADAMIVHEDTVLNANADNFIAIHAAVKRVAIAADFQNLRGQEDLQPTASYFSGHGTTAPPCFVEQNPERLRKSGNLLIERSKTNLTPL